LDDRIGELDSQDAKSAELNGKLTELTDFLIHPPKKLPDEPDSQFPDLRFAPTSAVQLA
jgi:hypothetical protein